MTNPLCLTLDEITISKRTLKMQKLRYKSLAVDEKYFCKNVPALTEMQRIFFPHSHLTKLAVALAHSFFEHDRNGEPVFLVLFDFRAVISGVGFVSCGQSYISSSTIKFVYILWIKALPYSGFYNRL